MKNRLWLFVFSVLLSTGSFAQVDLIKSLDGNVSETIKKNFEFKPIINIEATSVKNQGRSGTCWSYSGNSFLESEMLKKGEEAVNLSQIYTARCVYLEKAKMYVRLHGNLKYADGGELHDVINMYRKYGAIPQSAYDGLNYGTSINNFGEMQAALKGFLEGIVQNKNGKLTKNWVKAFDAVLDSYLGKVPEKFEYKGKTYTPQSFAKEVVGLDADNYIELTSVPDEPLYEKVFLAIPDNWSFDYAFNIKMNDITEVIDHALKEGYTVGWATDVSEKYFSWKNGIAYVPEADYQFMTKEEQEQMFTAPHKERKITPEMRKEAFENYETTDDHGMHIIGLAKDKNGKEYYIVKNSWGTSNDYNGYIFVTKTYVQYKTIALLLNKKGLPKTIKKKV